MSFLLSLIFLAAVVGIFKPFIKGWKRRHFVIGAAVSFVLVGIVGMQNLGNELEGEFKKQEEARLASTDTPTKIVEEGQAPDEPAKPKSDWTYDSSKDEMRGGTTYYAELSGSNTLNLDFPYGEQQGRLIVRQSPQFGFDILVGVDSGQILCRSYGNTKINVKFDDGPIRSYGCSSASDGTNNMVFVKGAKGFLANLKKSKRMVVEAEFYHNGMQQMTFDTAGLEWEH